MKILAVDDDASILELIDHTLSISAHHDVTTAASAAQALARIDMIEDMFDCFLIDIQMPDVDGIDLTRLIRRTAGYERQPVVMLTAMHERPYLDMAFHAGATDYITKPFSFRDLRRRIFEAQKLTCEETQPAPHSTKDQNLVLMRGELIHEGPIALPDRDELPTLLPYAEFENYVQEIARGFLNIKTRRRNVGPTILGLKLANPTLTRAEYSQEEIQVILGDVVQGAGRVLGQNLSSISYRGNGSFLCVLDKPVIDSSGNVERELNVFLQYCLKNASENGLQIFVGNQVPLRTSSPSAVLDILWMAIESVERKFVIQRDRSKPRHAC